ncbi:Protein of unknown function [Bacillus mycoides]|nr:Protein of unknown function [Bacillus mycoides]
MKRLVALVKRQMLSCR